MLDRPRPEDQAEAERLFRRVLKNDPQLAEAHVGLSRMASYLYALGVDESDQRLRAASSEAEAALAIDPHSAEAGAALAWALTLANRLTPALAAAQAAAQNDPESFEAHLALCMTHRLKRHLGEALAECRRAADLAPDHPRVLVGLADVLRDMEQNPSALRLYVQAVDLDHESVLAQLAAAANLQAVGNYTAAARVYNSILERQPFARTRVLQAAAAMRVSAEDHEGALEFYEGLDLPKNASLPTLLSLYGKGYTLMRLGRPAEAEYFLSTLIERVPGDYDGPERGREILFLAYDDLVRYFDAQHKPQRSEALLSSAAARPRAPVRFARRLAARMQEKGDGRSGIAPLERALLGSDPADDPLEMADAALLLARLKSQGGRKAVPSGSPSGQALQLVEQRVADSPLGVAHYRLARAFALARDPDRSLECLARARRGGFLPGDQAAVEDDFAILRNRSEFQEVIKD